MSLSRRITERFGFEIRRVGRQKARDRSVRLAARGQPVRGKALLAYVIKPFLLQPGETLPSSHTHFLESVLLSEVLRDLGFDVEVIDFENAVYEPTGEYSLLISSRMHFSRYAGLLGEDCLKIAHLDVSHWLFNNASALMRCYEVRERRGVALSSYRPIEENRAIEDCDAAVMLGNAVTAGTYAFAGKTLHTMPVPVAHDYPKPDKDYSQVRKRFLWLGSRGFVQKGLDLVLEAFAAMPEYRLTVCGPIDREKEFAKAFRRELYETENIRTLGWIDVAGEEFQEIANQHLALVYPSCAEGQAGAGVVCMSAGIIPVVSPQSGLNMEPGMGILLPELSVKGIQEAIKTLSGESDAQLEERTLAVWEYARQNHNAESYKTRYREIIETLWNEKH